MWCISKDLPRLKFSLSTEQCATRDLLLTRIPKFAMSEFDDRSPPTSTEIPSFRVRNAFRPACRPLSENRFLDFNSGHAISISRLREIYEVARRLPQQLGAHEAMIP